MLEIGVIKKGKKKKDSHKVTDFFKIISGSMEGYATGKPPVLERINEGRANAINSALELFSLTLAPESGFYDPRLPYQPIPNKTITQSSEYIRKMNSFKGTHYINEDYKNEELKYKSLITKYYFSLKNNNINGFQPNDAQKSMFIKVLRELSKKPDFDINDLSLKISSDDELIVMRKGENGKHYMTVGEEINDISYVFVGNKKGEYKVIPYDEDSMPISQLITSFLYR